MKAMPTTIIGDPATFAIEYELESAYPPYGRIRLWLERKRFGDIALSMFLYHMCSSLEAMMVRNPRTTPAVYVSQSDAPSDDTLFSEVSWSWGESFDDFVFALYAAQNDGLVHFVWKLERETETLHDDCPGPHHVAVPYMIYDKVVGELLRNLSYYELEARSGS